MGRASAFIAVIKIKLSEAQQAACRWQPEPTILRKEHLQNRFTILQVCLYGLV
jgi:hypothetical protein